MYKCFVDIRKEEAWLNEQLQAGYKLEAVGTVGSYRFTSSPDARQVVRLDFAYRKKLPPGSSLQGVFVC